MSYCSIPQFQFCNCSLCCCLTTCCLLLCFQILLLFLSINASLLRYSLYFCKISLLFPVCVDSDFCYFFPNHLLFNLMVLLVIVIGNIYFCCDVCCWHFRSFFDYYLRILYHLQPYSTFSRLPWPIFVSVATFVVAFNLVSVAVAFVVVLLELLIVVTIEHICNFILPAFVLCFWLLLISTIVLFSPCFKFVLYPFTFFELSSINLPMGY